jgi:hypothetical protein
MEVSCQLYASAALPQEMSLQYPFNKRLGRPQRLSGCCGEKKNLLSLLRINTWERNILSKGSGAWERGLENQN